MGGTTERPQVHLGRLALLALVLIGAAFYVGPLREFFVQQDRYHEQTAALQAAQVDNEELKDRVELLNSEAYIGQQALAGSMLVPPDTQVFVIKGLPESADEENIVDENALAADSYSVLDRIEDLWRTLLK